MRCSFFRFIDEAERFVLIAVGILGAGDFAWNGGFWGGVALFGTGLLG